MGGALRSNDPFPLLTDAEIWLSGSGVLGGRGVLRDGGRIGKGRLSPGLFALAAVLAQFARRPELHDRHSSAASFLTAQLLAFEMKQLTGGRVAPHFSMIGKYVYRLRKKLAEIVGNGPKASAWAAQVLESQEHLGYRWSTSPERLHLDLAPTELQ